MFKSVEMISTDSTQLEIEKLRHKIFDCYRDIYKFKQYIQFKKNGYGYNWIKLIKLNEGIVKELKIRIALLGG